MSLAELAQKLNISTSKLSKIETGKAKLTVDTATRVAQALQVPVISFLSESSSRPTSRRSITRNGRGEVHKTRGMFFEILSAGLKDSQNLFWKTTVTARSIDENGGWRQHPGQEFIFMLSGSLELHTRHYDPLVLTAGDSIFFDADQPHAYVAVDGDATLLMMNGTGDVRHTT